MERINNHDPVKAYMVNKIEFFGRDFFIDQRVYVPNPETELLVNNVINYIESINLQNGTFLDVGTGCGNLIITLALKFPKGKFYATDISNEAIEVARTNAKTYNVNINFINTNFVENVEVEPDVILCNLPWGDDDHLMQTNSKETLSLMPDVAIFSPYGIVGSYLKLLEQIKDKNWKSKIFAEIGLLPKSIIEENISKEYDWEFVKLDHPYFKYSILKINMVNQKVEDLKHHHLIYQGEVNPDFNNDDLEKELSQFLVDIVKEINMKILIPPKVCRSEFNAWTGIVGIVTSHISFHYWVDKKLLQLDIYSCKKFDAKKTLHFLKTFWKTKKSKSIFLERGLDEDFKITKL